MNDLLRSPVLPNLILLVIALEAVGVSVYRRRTGKGPELRPFLLNLAAGAALVLALRAALLGVWSPQIAMWLALAGVAHVFAVRGRWKG